MFISLDSDQEDDLCKVRTVLGYLSCALSNRNITCNCLSTRQDNPTMLHELLHRLNLIARKGHFHIILCSGMSDVLGNSEEWQDLGGEIENNSLTCSYIMGGVAEQNLLPAYLA